MSNKFIDRLNKALDEALGSAFFSRTALDSALDFIDQYIMSVGGKLARELEPMSKHLRGQGPADPTTKRRWSAMLKKLAKKTRFGDEREHFLDLAGMLDPERHF